MRGNLEVPNGPFDIVPRFYLPHEETISGAWEIPRAELVKNNNAQQK
jgi:hypothetical protein